MLRTVIAVVLLAVGGATAPAQPVLSPQQWERDLRTMSDSATAELVAVLWEYTMSLVRGMTVAIQQADVRQRVTLEWMLEEWLTERLATIEISTDSAKALTSILEDYISQATHKALSTSPPIRRQRPDTTPAMSHEDAAANRRRLTGN